MDGGVGVVVLGLKLGLGPGLGLRGILGVGVRQSVFSVA